MGKTAHAAKPEGSINATKVLFELIATLPQLSEAEKNAVKVVAEVLKDCHGAGIGVEVEDEPSGKLTHINGVDAMENNNLQLKLDIRYPVTMKGEELFASIENISHRSEQKQFCATTPFHAINRQIHRKSKLCLQHMTM